MAPFVEITNSIMGDTMLLSILQAFTDSSLSPQYRPMLLCEPVHFMCMAVFRPFIDSSLNPQYRLMLLVHLCTLCAPSESSLNQLKCCWLCKCVRSVFSLCRTKSCIIHFSAKVSLEFPWNLAHFLGTLVLQSGA